MFLGVCVQDRAVVRLLHDHPYFPFSYGILSLTIEMSLFSNHSWLVPLRIDVDVKVVLLTLFMRYCVVLCASLKAQTRQIRSLPSKLCDGSLMARNDTNYHRLGDVALLLHFNGVKFILSVGPS